MKKALLTIATGILTFVGINSVSALQSTIDNINYPDLPDNERNYTILTIPAEENSTITIALVWNGNAGEITEDEELYGTKPTGEITTTNVKKAYKYAGAMGWTEYTEYENPQEYKQIIATTKEIVDNNDEVVYEEGYGIEGYTSETAEIDGLFGATGSVITAVLTGLATVATALMGNTIFQVMFGILIFYIILGIIFVLVRKTKNKGR